MMILVTQVGTYHSLFPISILILALVGIEIVVNINNAVEKHNSDNGNKESV